MSISPERKLWQAVIYRAAMDAINPCNSDEGIREQRAADIWFRGNGRDFKRICNMAGMDSDFVHEAYVSGRIDAKLLKAEVPA